MTLVPSLSMPKKGHARWALVPVGLLASSFFGVGWMAIIAVRDPSFALEPDYYQKAIHWDQAQAQAANNERLGYAFSVPGAVVSDSRGLATLQLKINDRSGRAVRGAHVSATAFPNAFSEDISQIQFNQRAPGVYEAPVKVRHAGLWEFRVTMDDGADHVTTVLRIVLAPGGAA